MAFMNISPSNFIKAGFTKEGGKLKKIGVNTKSMKHIS